MYKLIDPAFLTEAAKDDIEDLLDELGKAGEEPKKKEPEKKEPLVDPSVKMRPTEFTTPEKETPEAKESREKKAEEKYVREAIAARLQKKATGANQFLADAESRILSSIVGKNVVNVGTEWYDLDLFKQGKIEAIEVPQKAKKEAENLAHHALLYYWATNFGMTQASLWLDPDGGIINPTEIALQISLYAKGKKDGAIEPEKSFADYMKEQGYDRQKLEWQDTKPYEAGKHFIEVMKERLLHAKESAESVIRAALESGIGTTREEAVSAIGWQPPLAKRLPREDEYTEKYGAKVRVFRRRYNRYIRMAKKAETAIKDLNLTIGKRREGATGYDPEDFEILPLGVRSEDKNKLMTWQRVIEQATGMYQRGELAGIPMPTTLGAGDILGPDGELTPKGLHYVMSIAVNMAISYHVYQAIKEVEKIFEPRKGYEPGPKGFTKEKPLTMRPVKEEWEVKEPEVVEVKKSVEKLGNLEVEFDIVL